MDLSQVERKIANLQRRVRSLSDSAISSDFTEPESTSVSPRNSRIPVSDIKMDGFTTEQAFYSSAFPQTPQHVYLSRREGDDAAQLLAYFEKKHGEEKIEKSLEDSGNIHDDQWQDTCSGQEEECLGSSVDTPRGRLTPTEEGGTQDTSSLGLGDATRSQHTVSGSGRKLIHSGHLLPSSQQLQRAQPKSLLPSHRAGSGHASFAERAIAQPHQLESFSGQVMDAVLSVQQSWPTTAFESYSHLRKKRKGLLGRRTKSVNDLTELMAARDRCCLEEALFEQVRVIMQTARAPSEAASRTTARDDMSSADRDMQHLPDASAQSSHHIEESAGSGTAKIPSLETHAHMLKEASRQAATQIVKAGAGRSERGHVPTPSHRVTIHPLNDQASAVSDSETDTTTPVCGSFTASSMSDESDTTLSDMRGRLEEHSDSDGMISDEYLLTSGELEVAAINARAAVRNSRPETDNDSASRALSPGEEILAGIIARQWGVSSDANNGSSPKRLDQLRIRGGSPPRRPPSRREGCLSPEELSLPEETLQHLQQGLDEDETLEDVFQSADFERLQGEGLSPSQQRMLRSKASSVSCVGQGHYAQEEDEQEVRTVFMLLLFWGCGMCT